MKNIIIAKRLIKIAKSLIADKKDVKGINHIPYNEHSMTAYHGSSSKLSKITAHTTGAYQDKGNVIFLTQYFGQACAFALNANKVSEFLESKGIKDCDNVENNMTFEDNIEKKSNIVKSIDIDLYVTTNQDFDKDTISCPIYIHEVNIAPYLDNIEDVRGHDFQFIIKDVDSIPVEKVHEVQANFHIQRSIAGKNLDILTDFMKKNFHELKDVDYGYQYQSNEKGNLYFNFTDKSPDIYVFIQPPQNISQSLPSINLEAEHKLNGIDETMNFLKKNKNQIMQILKGEKNPKS